MGIASSKFHCIAWDIEGDLYSWGDALDGKLGHPCIQGSYKYIELAPTKVIKIFKKIQILFI